MKYPTKSKHLERPMVVSYCFDGGQGRSNKALQKIRNKQRLWKLYRTTGNNDDYIKYKEALNATTKEIISSKRMFEHKLATNKTRQQKFLCLHQK